MHGLMMDQALTLPAILRRAERVFGHKRIASRDGDGRTTRCSYRDLAARIKQLAVSLQCIGIRPGDRVATLAWNHLEHLEVYFAAPSIGAVLHTLNLRLHPDDLAHIVNDAGDKLLFVDASLLPLYAQIRDRIQVQDVIVMGGHDAVDLPGYEAFLGEADAADFAYVEPDERAAAAMCYTSGTTGRPKGVVYSHRALALHSLACASVDTLGIRESDTVLPVVPMFHINAWGLPFTAALTGANLVLPGPRLDPKSLIELMEAERVTVAAGVPTVWMGVLQALDGQSGPHDLSRLRSIITGGSAAPLAMIKGYEDRHGLQVLHAWGMTELTPVGSVAATPSYLDCAPGGARDEYRRKQGVPMPFLEIRAYGEAGPVAWDGHSLGELEVRGPCVARQYYNQPDGDDRFTADGWFRTGDIVSIDEYACIEIHDRAKDLVKSGGEWISSVALENALMAHPAIAEAAVIAVPHPKWDERPLAAVVLRPDRTATADELREFLAPRFAKWWLPDAVVFIEAIPRTSAGKFRKSELRDRYRHHYAMAQISGSNLMTAVGTD